MYIQPSASYLVWLKQSVSTCDGWLSYAARVAELIRQFARYVSVLCPTRTRSWSSCMHGSVHTARFHLLGTS